MNIQDRLMKRWGNNSAVPCNINIDFALELDTETWNGLCDIFNRLADYEDTGLSPSDITPAVHGGWECGEPCPVCGEDRFKNLDADIWADWQPPFCPNCGSRMDGGIDDA